MNLKVRHPHLNMPIIFKAETNEAYQMRILSEILASNLKTGYFDIGKDGIKLKAMDNPRYILLNLSLNSDNFTSYKFKSKGNIYAGLTMSHLEKMLKPIKKKDTLQFYIDQKDDTELAIRTIPKESNTGTSVCFIKIQKSQCIDIDFPEPTTKPITVLSTEFQKMCKNTLKLSKVTTVEVKDGYIKFTCNADGLMKRAVEFGDLEDSDVEDDEDTLEYTHKFPSDNLARITKLGGLSNMIQIYHCESPSGLLFRTNVGEIGKISVFVKNQQQIDEDKIAIQEDE